MRGSGARGARASMQSAQKGAFRAQLGQVLACTPRVVCLQCRTSVQYPALETCMSITWQYSTGDTMETTSVSSKGRVTIPKELRQRLGIRQGSRIAFLLVGDHVVMRVHRSPAAESVSGFGLLKSRRAAVPADLDPASLVNR